MSDTFLSFALSTTAVGWVVETQQRETSKGFLRCDMHYDITSAIPWERHQATLELAVFGTPNCLGRDDLFLRFWATVTAAQRGPDRLWLVTRDNSNRVGTFLHAAAEVVTKSDPHAVLGPAYNPVLDVNTALYLRGVSLTTTLPHRENELPLDSLVAQARHNLRVLHDLHLGRDVFEEPWEM